MPLMVTLSVLYTMSGKRSLQFIGMGTGRAGAAVAPPTKLSEEQLVHPTPPIFSATYS